jgi:hypothetical protein
LRKNPVIGSMEQGSKLLPSTLVEGALAIGMRITPIG